MSYKQVLIIKNVSFAYENMTVLTNVNLEIDSGAFISIVGPNGGGKTTLLKLILGLIKPKKGEIEVLGQSPINARQKIGYVAQYAMFDPKFPVTAMDVVLMGRLGGNWRGAYSRIDKKAALTALEQVGISSLANRSFSVLSGGEKQRLLIARALVAEPKLLLLDEPTASIDASGEIRFAEILARLNKLMTILIVTHDLGFVSHLVKRVICVNKRVTIHSTSELTDDVIKNIYGGDLRIVNHDKICAQGESDHA